MAEPTERKIYLRCGLTIDNCELVPAGNCGELITSFEDENPSSTRPCLYALQHITDTFKRNNDTYSGAVYHMTTKGDEVSVKGLTVSNKKFSFGVKAGRTFSNIEI